MRSRIEGQGLIVRLARAVSLERREPLSRAQRLVRAFFWVCLGAGAAMLAEAQRQRAFPGQVVPLEPKLERHAERLTVVRFPFAHEGVQVACYVILNHQERTWVAKC